MLADCLHIIHVLIATTPKSTPTLVASAVTGHSCRTRARPFVGCPVAFKKGIQERVG